MTITGKDSQVGIAVETTYGTRVAPSTFLRARSVGLKKSRALIKDDGVIAGRLTDDTVQICEGDVTVAGPLSLPLYRGTKLAAIFEAMMGAASGLGTLASPFLYTPADGLDSLSVQVGYGGTGGTVHPVDYNGVKIGSWSLGAQQGAKSALDLDLVGRDAVDNLSLASASYTRPRTYAFVHATMTIGGAARKVKSVTFSGNNGLETGRRVIGSALINEPVAGSLREYKAEATVEFENFTDYQTTYLGGIASPVTIVGTFTDGTDILTVTQAGFLDDTPLPDVNNRGPLEAKLVLMAAGAGTDASACTIQQNTAT
jgi:tail tube protein